MATPRRIFSIYHQLAANAAEIRDFVIAKGEKSGTLDLLVKGDRTKLLARWGEEMTELCGVLDGTHNDSYLMEATQTFYWGCLFAVSGGATWETIAFDTGRRQAATCKIDTVPEVRASVDRLIGLGAANIKPEKLFLVWNAADWIYRRQTPADKQWSLEQLMEADLQDMKKRSYLVPIINEIAD
jgi:phosphoribosyl-ATP pyrophosphohydrolase